jgi:D-3-phosphoglycerate dehydrogenase
VPGTEKYLIDKKDINLMKNGSGILNLARGGVVKEEELLIALDSEKLAFAAIDTFENEPKPKIKILMNSKISLSPHIGAATLEAQDRIGIELAEKIIEILK